jgi:hypothetical protein
MMTVDEVLAALDSAHPLHPAKVLAAEVRRLRSEIDSAREDLQSFIEDRNHWKARAEAAEADAASWADQCSQRVADWDEMRIRAETAEAVLQNLMSFLSVNGSWADLSADEAEKRIREGIDMLMRPVLARAEAAEAALKEAQEQEPLTWETSSELMDILKNPIFARPVPAAPTKFTDSELDEIHQLAYELGGTESGEYILDGEQLDQVIVKAASLFYKPAVPKPAVSVLGADDQLSTLMRFYQVSDIPSLALAQAKHIERLQAKLPAMRDDMPRNPRGA